MTTSSIKVNIVRRPVLKLKVLPKFPASVSVLSPILLDRTGGNYAFSLDVNALRTSLDLIYLPVQTQQIKTTAGNVAVANTDGIIAINKTVGAATVVTLPLSSAKIGPCLIADFKGDAGTNNITITLSGSDKFPGGLSSWIIAADGGSVFLRPLAGVGYTL